MITLDDMVGSTCIPQTRTSSKEGGGTKCPLVVWVSSLDSMSHVPLNPGRTLGSKNIGPARISVPVDVVAENRSWRTGGSHGSRAWGSSSEPWSEPKDLIIDLFISTFFNEFCDRKVWASYNPIPSLTSSPTKSE